MKKLMLGMMVFAALMCAQNVWADNGNGNSAGQGNGPGGGNGPGNGSGNGLGSGGGNNGQGQGNNGGGGGGSVVSSTTFNLSMTVDKYIECTPGPLAWDFGTTSHQNGYGMNGESLYGTMGEWNLAYANCPFSVTVSGNNGANQGVPRFARQEVGAHGGAWDILPTLYAINFTTNGVRDLFYGTWLQGANQFPYTKSYLEAPHNGQVKMDMTAYINSTVASEAVPVLQTLINPAFTKGQSADAGLYSCTMLVTLTAL